MTSEGSDTLILPFTSKMGQSVAENRQMVFYFGFTSKERTYFGILYAYFQTPDLMGTRDITKRIGIFVFFKSIYIPAFPPPILGIPDIQRHLSRHYETSSHASCRVK